MQSPGKQFINTMTRKQIGQAHSEVMISNHFGGFVIFPVKPSRIESVCEIVRADHQSL